MKRNVRPCSVCKISQQVQDVGLNRDVQGGDAFVGHEKAGIGNQSTGDRDTLALDQRQTASHFGDMLETASGEIRKTLD